MKRHLVEESTSSKSTKLTPTAAPFSSETLTHILCFLDAKDVVSASLVSSQWNGACTDYQEPIWKAVCSNALNNLEKYPFMKNVKGEKFDIQAYEGIYSSWKETFVNLFYGQLKEFTSQYDMFLNEAFANVENKEELLEIIKKRSTLAIPYTFAGQDDEDNEEKEEDDKEEEDKEEGDDDEGEECKDKTPIGCSKIGGLPDLPKGMKWPNVIDEEDHLLKFVCQINLADLKNYHSIKGILPRCGWLFCFIDWENLESDDYKEPYSFYWNGPINMLERVKPEEELEFETHKVVQIQFKKEVVQPFSSENSSRLDVNEAYSDLGTSLMGYPQAVQAEEEMLDDDRYFILQYQNGSLTNNLVDTSDSVFYWMLPLTSREKIHHIKDDKEQIRVPLFTTFQC